MPQRLPKQLANLLPISEGPSTRDGGDGEHDRVGLVLQTPIEELHAHPRQPRQPGLFDGDDELTASVRALGILEPLLVAPRPEGGHTVICGHRRLAAAKAAGLTHVPVMVRRLDEREALEVILVENLQRRDLGVMEEADTMRALAGEFGMTQAAIAEAIGKSEDYIGSRLRLFHLPADIQSLVREGTIQLTQARALVKLYGEDGKALISERKAMNLTKEIASAAERGYPWTGGQVDNRVKYAIDEAKREEEAKAADGKAPKPITGAKGTPAKDLLNVPKSGPIKARLPEGSYVEFPNWADDRDHLQADAKCKACPFYREYAPPGHGYKRMVCINPPCNGQRFQEQTRRREESERARFNKAVAAWDALVAKDAGASVECPACLLRVALLVMDAHIQRLELCCPGATVDGGRPIATNQQYDRWVRQMPAGELAGVLSALIRDEAGQKAAAGRDVWRGWGSDALSLAMPPKPKTKKAKPKAEAEPETESE